MNIHHKQIVTEYWEAAYSGENKVNNFLVQDRATRLTCELIGIAREEDTPHPATLVVGIGARVNDYYAIKTAVGGNVVAIDMSDNLIKNMAMYKVPVYAIDITSDKVVLKDQKGQPVSFDYIMARWVLHAIPADRLENAINNLVQLARPAGTILVEYRSVSDEHKKGSKIEETTCGEVWIDMSEGKLHYRHYLYADKVIKLFVEKGAKEVSTEVGNFSKLGDNDPLLVRQIFTV